MKIAKTNNINKKVLRSLLLGTGIGAAVIILLLLLTALIMSKSGKLPYEALNYTALGIICVGAFSGGYTAARSIGSNGLLTGAIVGSVLFIILFVSGLIHGTDGISLFTIYKAISCVIPSILGGILGVNKREKIKIK